MAFTVKKDDNSVYFSGNSCFARVDIREGCNLRELILDDWHTLLYPVDKELPRGASGMPIMFPYANRLKNAEFDFEDKHYKILKNGNPVLMHGFVGDECFDFVGGKCDNHSAQVTFSFEVSKKKEIYNSYPFDVILLLTYTLTKNSLKLDWTVENRGLTNAPFGFGVHTFFRKTYPDTTFISIPSTSLIEAVDYFPTGKTLNVRNSDFDLSHERAVNDLELDHLYHLDGKSRLSYITYSKEQVRIELDASENMQYMMVFTPHRIHDAFCLENQTNATDAMNLYSRGYKEMSGLLIAQPQKKISGWLKITKTI